MVLSILLAILTAMALVMQWVRAEETHLDLLALAAPIWLMGFPMMALVAALAVLFESLPLLRGGFGNIVYFFAWIFSLTFLLSSLNNGERIIPQVNDIFGMTRIIVSMQSHILAIDPLYNGDFSIGRTAVELRVNTFAWPGIPTGLDWVYERLTWLCAALLLAAAAALPFDRFDPSRDHKQAVPSSGGAAGLLSRLPQLVAAWIVPLRRFSPLHRLAEHSAFAAILLAELRLMLHGQPGWWYFGAGLLWLVGLFNLPLTGLHDLLPLIWLWPLLIWSPIGARESQHQTGALIFSAPHSLRRQMLAAWLSAVLVAALTGSSVALRLAAAGELAHLLGWGAGALFIASLALALGVCGKTPRLFELVYLLWWYLAFNGGTALDFMSRTPASLSSGMPYIYLILSLLLGLLAIHVRRRFPLSES